MSQVLVGCSWYDIQVKADSEVKKCDSCGLAWNKVGVQNVLYESPFKLLVHYNLSELFDSHEIIHIILWIFQAHYISM